MNGDSGTTPYRKETLHIAASMTSMRNPNLYRCISQTLICFNPTLNCQRVTQMMLHCVNLLDSSAFLQISLYSIGKLKGLPSFTDFVHDKAKDFGITVFLGSCWVDYWWYTPRQKTLFVLRQRFYSIKNGLSC